MSVFRGSVHAWRKALFNIKVFDKGRGEEDFYKNHLPRIVAGSINRICACVCKSDWRVRLSGVHFRKYADENRNNPTDDHDKA